MRPEYEIIGDENSRWIDYSIKRTRLRSHLFIFVLRINKIVYTNARQFRDEIIGLTMEIWMVLVLQQ
ncbi:unnamed protein product [Rhizophagus irregularis]|nr:unnamed protein product [Rhizophagus irregularis]